MESVLTVVPSYSPLQLSSLRANYSTNCFMKTNMNELCMKKNIKKKACYYCKGTSDDQVYKKSSSSSSSSPLMRVLPESLWYESGFLGSVPNSERAGSTPQDYTNYLTNILSSKVYDVAIETQLQLARSLSERVGVNVWLKREDLQPVFAFKLRGAYNMMANLSKDQLNRGVICSSSGNHAQGVALASQRLGCDALVVMPTTAPEIKWKAVEKLGGKAVLVGASFHEAQLYAKDRAKVEGRTFVPSFDHPHVIAGQGTIGMEILRHAKEPIHAIFAPIGGGGLIAGVASYVKMVCPEVKIIGVEPYDANAMALSLHHGQRIMLDQVGGFADGVAVKVVGEETFRICQDLIDGVVLVSRDAICAAIKDMIMEKKSILEPAGALALAGAEAYCKYYGLKGENVVAITSGANMDLQKLGQVTASFKGILLTLLPLHPGIKFHSLFTKWVTLVPLFEAENPSIIFSQDTENFCHIEKEKG
ncbi:hypothetical protein MKW92_000007, partial [Papaver armeniacum]